MSIPLSSPPEDQPHDDVPKPRRRRRSSRSRSSASGSGSGSTSGSGSGSHRRKKRVTRRRLKASWRRYGRFLPYIILFVGLPAALGFGLYTLHRLSQQGEPPSGSRAREERSQAWSGGPRAFNLTNLTKMDLAGERSSYGRSLQVGADVLPGKEILAEAAFKGKNYAEAEMLYSELLQTARRKAPVQYHRFISLVFLGRRDEAELIFPANGKPSPAWFYSRAVLSFVDGDKETANKLIEEARIYHPTLCGEYDPALRTLGFIE